MTSKKKFTLLGTGTSSGVPTIACECRVCQSSDRRDKRLRTSLLIESPSTTVIIDTGPDFRQQMLIQSIKKIDGVVYTHHHFDHIGGFDDIRAFNFRTEKSIPIYLNNATFLRMKEIFSYAFSTPEQLGGGVPMIDINNISYQKFQIGDIDIMPIPLLHGNLEILGFRIDNFAYCTDTNKIPQASYKLLEGLDILILDALRYQKHPTHFNLDEAIEEAKRINAKKTFFTHITHDMKHSEVESTLCDGLFLAFDFLSFEL